MGFSLQNARVNKAQVLSKNVEKKTKLEITAECDRYEKKCNFKKNETETVIHSIFGFIDMMLPSFGINKLIDIQKDSTIDQ